MEAKLLTLVSIAVSVVVFRVCRGVELDLTVEIDAGVRECFWQHFKDNIHVELEYQVIDGGDLDIDFYWYDPNERPLREEMGNTENDIRIKTYVAGEYKFCFDNSRSRISSKVVFFELMTDSEEDEDEEDWKFELEEVHEMADLTVQQIKGIVDRSRRFLDKSIQLQVMLKMHGARDSNTMEANLYRVNVFSAFQVFVMITVSLTQVLMIRSLFKEKGYERAGLRQKT